MNKYKLVLLAEHYRLGYYASLQYQGDSSRCIAGLEVNNAPNLWCISSRQKLNAVPGLAIQFRMILPFVITGDGTSHTHQAAKDIHCPGLCVRTSNTNKPVMKRHSPRKLFPCSTIRLPICAAGWLNELGLSRQPASIRLASCIFSSSIRRTRIQIPGSESAAAISM
ncbi:hypothetical protein ASPVEDRAFT_872672 [Aspergillus versicolor CBS 583.65]|uniref:Uncharacterized protein n=1 Tax=Aspergillus versicolor CBS 583.65 TaxID=1036611 RepID=A0A1L9P5C3_ASPVE|nr:uncharacterized protein ASPVEDRAFT_872672 [Aspergillus versicolor CBS 583.65]OJI96731.1 hypothetical protein ASPVEDRAFT_872672 [Aspergillus versicolor CBS 583.65]